MALPREMELLDLEQFEANKTLKSPSRKPNKKKHGGKRNGVDGNEVCQPILGCRKQRLRYRLNCYGNLALQQTLGVSEECHINCEDIARSDACCVLCDHRL